MMDSAVPRVTEDSKTRFPRAAEYLTELDGFLVDYESRVGFRFTPENPPNPELSIRDKVLLLLLSTTSSARWTTWTTHDLPKPDNTHHMFAGLVSAPENRQPRRAAAIGLVGASPELGAPKK